ncbi:hypothetical protein CRE_21951 [Caenorhabditis remanei]|uniref:VWFA domain-containing protein n=1 Tax=Caenorhabditis remanei TaxID=31234 RepID=E3MUI1_CAERE|nr:hypothetical protein CRE_21951 [Caenorhabditis remanei]
MFFRVFWLFLFASFWRFVITVDLQKEGICPPVLDIIILFDTSGGNDTVFEQQKNWTIKIVRDLPIHEDAVRVGLIQYSDAAKTEFNLSRYSERNDIITHLETLTFMPGEDTRTGVALDKADEEMFNYIGGARLKATRLIILFTDGLSMDKPTKSAKTLRRKGVKIYTISVNSIGFVPEMLGIVGDADNVFGPTDEDRIEERLLTEVEHSRSCEVQPKRHEKTTSSFGLKITDFIAINPESSEVNFANTTTIPTTTTSESFARDPENSDEADGDNNVEDIGRNETETTVVMEITTTSPVSLSWKEPIQLFTVEAESTHENKVLNLTNLKTSLAEESNTSEAKEINDTVFETASTGQTPDDQLTLSTELPTSSVSVDSPTVTTNSVEISSTPASSPEPTTVLTTLPPVTTICINAPTTTVTSSTGSSNLSSSTSKSFLVKLGVEKEKKEKDPVSKFLGRDVSNSNFIKEEKEEVKLSENNSEEPNASETKTLHPDSSVSENKTTSVPPAATNRFFFSTRVTFRPVSSTTRISTTSSIPSTTSTATTTSATTTTGRPVPTTTTLSLRSSTLKQKIESTESSTTSTSPSSPVTPPQKSAFLFQTLSAVTAFPTLLSMEKAVTLPINNALGVSKPMKKKIRRIIKRRRNILPSSQAKKVTDKVVEVKRVPTPTTPPIRSTLRPIIIEEKEEEIFSSSVQCPMDILFVVDSSGSIARTYDTQKDTHFQDYLTQLIKKVEPSRSHRVGLIQFAGPHIQKMEWSFDTHSKNSQLLSAIRSVRHLTGTTYIGAALELSLILLDSRRKHTETTVILISDGFSQDDSTQQAKLLRQLPNVKMYAISLNKLTNTKYLTDIVGDRKNLFINDESHWFEEFFTKKLRCVPTTR